MMAASRLLAMARGGDAPPVLARTLAGARHRRPPSSSSWWARLSAPWGRGTGGERGVLAGARDLRSGECRAGALAVHAPDQERPFRAAASGRVPLPTLLGLLVVLLVLTRFEPRVYGIAAVMLALAFVVQAIPWKQALVPGESPP